MFSCRQQLHFSRHQQHAAAQRLPCRRCGSAHRRVRCWGRPTQRPPHLDVATPTTAADGALFGVHAPRFDVRPWTAVASTRTWSAEVVWSRYTDAVSLLASLCWRVSRCTGQRSTAPLLASDVLAADDAPPPSLDSVLSETSSQLMSFYWLQRLLGADRLQWTQFLKAALLGDRSPTLVRVIVPG